MFFIIELLLLFFYIGSFLYLRYFLNEIISYVITKEDFLTKKKECSLFERFAYTRFNAVLPTWIRNWYYVEVIVICISYCCYKIGGYIFNGEIKSLMFMWGITFMFVPFINICLFSRRTNRYTGNMYDYSRIVDKYAIRKKLYPELYEDEDKNQSGEDQSD